MKKTKAKKKASARLTVEQIEAIERYEFLKRLLAEFGAEVSGFDPGVAATFKGGSISFPRAEWAWLEPLLIELAELRRP